jgi:hypothetical protein
MSETLGTASQLQLIIPEALETDWATSIRDNCFQKIVEHDHTGSSGKGIQLTENSFADNAITFTKIRGANDEWFTARNFQNTGDINIVKVNTSDLLDFGATVSDDAFTIGDNADGTKALVFSLGGATTSSTMTIASSHTTGRTITLPDATDTLVGKATTDTLTNKTLTSPVLTTPQINDTSADHQYIVAVSELAADRTVTLPLLSGNDEFVFKDHSVTMTNKSFQDSTTSFVDDGDATKVMKFQLSGITTATTRTVTIPDADLTMVGTATTQTLTNKTIDADNNTITNIENADIKAGAAIDASKIANGSVSSAEFQYLGGVTSDVQTQINSKLPTTVTTTGDIIYSSSGSTASRLGIGSAGQVLQVSGGIPAWGTNTASPVATASINNTDSPYSAATSEDVILCDASSGVITVNLYAASSNDGRKITIKKTDSSTNIVTIDGNASETVEGSTTYLLHTQNQLVTLVCDGSNWHIVAKHNTTGWNSFTMSVTGSTSNPTKGTTNIDAAYWKREGINMHLMWTYRQTAAGSAGSGSYLFGLPTGFTMDTGVVTAATSAQATQIGSGSFQEGNNDATSATIYPGACYAYDSSNIGVLFWDQSAGDLRTTRVSLGSGSGLNFSTTSLFYQMNCIIPISGWEE